MIDHLQALIDHPGTSAAERDNARRKLARLRERDAYNHINRHATHDTGSSDDRRPWIENDEAYIQMRGDEAYAEMCGEEIFPSPYDPIVIHRRRS